MAQQKNHAALNSSENNSVGALTYFTLALFRGIIGANERGKISSSKGH